VASLRADLETARAIGVADYVKANLVAQIDACAQVAETMRLHLASLASDERAEVEEASRLLRRVRAAVISLSSQSEADGGNPTRRGPRGRQSCRQP